MAVENPTGPGEGKEATRPDSPAADPALESFGPVSSLEPDGLEADAPAAASDPIPGNELAIPLGADDPAALGPGGRQGKPKSMTTLPGGQRHGETHGVPGDAGKRRLARLLDRIRGTRHATSARAPAENAPAAPDWSHGPAPEAPVPHAAYPADAAHAAHANSEAADLEDAESVFLLDDAFLNRTFREVHFPASKELVLRYVDMEQDFAYGQDRTLNLHTLITHLEQAEFRTRKELLDAIHGRLLQHH